MARPGKAGLFMEYISYTEAAECALHKLKEHPRNIQRGKKNTRKNIIQLKRKYMH